MPGEEDTPNPDPTVRTTEGLLREISGLKALLEMEMAGVRDLTGQQFQLIERQRVEQKQDTKAAVDAALSAAKEAVKEQTSASEKAVAKTEASFSEQLKAQSATAATGLVGLTTVVTDLKERVVQMESVKVGSQQTYAGLYALTGVVLGIAAIVVAIILKS